MFCVSQTRNCNIRNFQCVLNVYSSLAGPGNTDMGEKSPRFGRHDIKTSQGVSGPASPVGMSWRLEARAAGPPRSWAAPSPSSRKKLNSYVCSRGAFSFQREVSTSITEKKQKKAVLLRDWARGAGRPLWARAPSLEGRQGPEAWIPARGRLPGGGWGRGGRAEGGARRSPLSFPGARPHLTSPRPGHFREKTATADAGFRRSNLGGRSTSPNDPHVPGGRTDYFQKIPYTTASFINEEKDT